MTQATLNGNSYERQASLKAAMTLEGAMIQAGLLKPEGMEDAYLIAETYAKRFLSLLTEGQDTQSLTKQGFTEAEQKQPSNISKSNTGDVVRLATKPQQKALYAISMNNPDANLTKDTEKYTFKEASEFIERHGKK